MNSRKGHLWYLHGFCRKRQDFRLFKLSRMRDLAMTGEVFTRRQCELGDYPLDQAWDTGHAPPPPAGDRSALFPRVRVRVEDQFDADEIEVAADGSLLIKAIYPEEEWVSVLIVGFGEDVELLAHGRLFCQGPSPRTLM
ncbi:MAG: WYL domain-containing protein [Firmicutes bacterium]|nr:WYL domain-containing protein [Bacillota bacterium]